MKKIVLLTVSMMGAVFSMQAAGFRKYSETVLHVLRTAAYGSRGVTVRETLKKEKQALGFLAEQRAILESKKRRGLVLLEQLWAPDELTFSSSLELERLENEKELTEIKSDLHTDQVFLRAFLKKEEAAKIVFNGRLKAQKNAIDQREKDLCAEIKEFREELVKHRFVERDFLSMTLKDKKKRILELNERQWTRKFSSFKDHFAFSKAYADDKEKEALLADVLRQDPLFSEVLATSDEAFATRKKYKTIKPSFPSEQEQQAMIIKKEEEERKERERDRALSKEVRRSVGKFWLAILGLSVLTAGPFR